MAGTRVYPGRMRIGELAQAAGVAVSTVRFYEREGLLPQPRRLASGWRDYPPAALERLRFVRAASAAGLRLDDARRLLDARDDGQAPCGEAAEALAARLEEVTAQIDELMAVRRRLQRHLAEARAMDPSRCDPARVCEAVNHPQAATGS